MVRFLRRRARSHGQALTFRGRCRNLRCTEPRAASSGLWRFGWGDRRYFEQEARANRWRVGAGKDKLAVCGPRGSLASGFIGSIGRGSCSDVRVEARLVVAIGAAACLVLVRQSDHEVLVVIRRRACGLDTAGKAVHRRFR